MRCEGDDHVRMRRLLLGLAACCLAAGMNGATAPATTGTHNVVIRLLSKNTIVSFSDKAPKSKISPGDRIVSKSTLRNEVAQFGKPKGALVGRDWATVTIVSDTAYEIHGYAVLPGGRILFAGRVRSAAGKPEVVPVTGGTGAFAHARGASTATGAGTLALNVYRLTLP
jgi:hypothetical protein